MCVDYRRDAPLRMHRLASRVTPSVLLSWIRRVSLQSLLNLFCCVWLSKFLRFVYRRLINVRRSVERKYDSDDGSDCHTTYDKISGRLTAMCIVHLENFTIYLILVYRATSDNLGQQNKVKSYRKLAIQIVYSTNRWDARTS